MKHPFVVGCNDWIVLHVWSNRDKIKEFCLMWVKYLRSVRRLVSIFRNDCVSCNVVTGKVCAGVELVETITFYSPPNIPLVGIYTFLYTSPNW